MSQHIEFREERDLGEKLNVTFGFIREHYKVLLSSSLYFVVPFALLAGVASGLYQNDQLQLLADIRGNGDTNDGFVFESVLGSPYYWLQLLFIFITIAMLSLTVYIYIVQFMDFGRKPQVSVVWAGVRSNFFKACFYTIGLMVAYLIGIVLLVFPGIYLAVACSIFLMVMVREETGFIETFERCFYLVKGNWWATFGFLIVVVIIQSVIAFIAAVPSWVIYILSALQVLKGENGLLVVIATAFSTIISLLVYIILVTATAFHYFSLVEIKDGIGLMEQVEKIGRRESDLAYEQE